MLSAVTDEKGSCHALVMLPALRKGEKRRVMTDTDREVAAGGRQSAAQNRLLAALPIAGYPHLFSSLEPVELAARQVLYEPDEAISHVYFPTSGAVSVFSFADGAGAVGIAMIGREGMLGLPIFLHASSSPERTVCQIPGEALRLAAPVLQEAAASQGLLSDLLLRYTQARLIEASQAGACNRLHEPVGRCARCLLATHDAVMADILPLTQDILALMLGLRRATVTAAASRLQQAGAIQYRRGAISILDRSRLEAAACVCYRIIKGEFDRMFAS